MEKIKRVSKENLVKIFAIIKEWIKDLTPEFESFTDEEIEAAAQEALSDGGEDNTSVTSL